MSSSTPAPRMFHNPDGTFTIEVRLSPAEWRKINDKYPYALTGEGTGSASIRKALGLHEVPKRPYPKGKL